MKLEYYPIRGRGQLGDQFQLARLQDEAGNLYKGQYDQARHFSSETDLKRYLATVVNVDEAQLSLQQMQL